MKTESNEPINPIKGADGRFIHESDANRDWINQTHPFLGLTKRELFAAMAMQGLCACHDYPIDWIPSQSVKIANLLIKELNKQEDENKDT